MGPRRHARPDPLQDQDQVAQFHARPHLHQQVSHHRRGAEPDAQADEDPHHPRRPRHQSGVPGQHRADRYPLPHRGQLRPDLCRGPHERLVAFRARDAAARRALAPRRPRRRSAVRYGINFARELLAGSLFPHTEFPLKPKEDDMFRAIPRGILAALAAALLVTASPAYAQQKDFKPHVGQQGKDVVWVPTPDEVVERMLNMAQAKPEDYVIDLGAGDGKIAIAAAKKFGARSLGVEYNPDMVALAQRNAQAAGVLGKAQIVQGDIFVTDFTQATVLTMYLLPSLNMRLRPQILAMRPGTRVVTHAFNMEDWEADETSDVDGRRVYFWTVPASVAGRWTLELSGAGRSEEHTSELQSHVNLVCRLLLEKKNSGCTHRQERDVCEDPWRH